MTRKLFPPVFDGIGYALRQEARSRYRGTGFANHVRSTSSAPPGASCLRPSDILSDTSDWRPGFGRSHLE